MIGTLINQAIFNGERSAKISCFWVVNQVWKMETPVN